MRFVSESPLSKRITELAEPVCAACGVDCYLVEVTGMKGRRMVRIFIDAIGGVSINDCTKVSRQLSAVLDVEDPIEGKYHLEVSSPGLERQLRDLDDVKKIIGEDIHLETSQMIEGRKRFSGKVVGVERETIQIEVEGRTYQVPASTVKKANLKYNFRDNHF